MHIFTQKTWFIFHVLIISCFLILNIKLSQPISASNIANFRIKIEPAKETNIIFSGKAYPKGTIILLKDEQTATETTADANADFEMTLKKIKPGEYVFSLYAEDYQSRQSPIITLPIKISQGTITHVEDIFIAPSIDIKDNAVEHGENVIIDGQSVPRGEIAIIIGDEKEPFTKINTDENGIYIYNLNTSQMKIEEHSVKSRIEEEVSPFSKTVTFNVNEKKFLGLGSNALNIIAVAAPVAAAAVLSLLYFSGLYKPAIPLFKKIFRKHK